MLLLPPLLFVLCVFSATNITIDDTDPSIAYVGEWSNGIAVNNVNDNHSYGGTHAWTTSDTAKATLTFNGESLHI